MKHSIVIFAGILLILSGSFISYAGEGQEDHICFNKIDSNQDNIVIFQEFKLYYGDDPEKFRNMDQNNDKQLSHDEYEEYLYNQSE